MEVIKFVSVHLLLSYLVLLNSPNGANGNQESSVSFWGGLKKSRLLHHHGGGGGGGGVAGGLAQGLQQYVGQQLVVPLLLSLISKIAALGPPIMAGVLGIFLLVLFAKKAFLFSFFALLVALSQKTKNDDHEIYIKKVNTYPHYNKEENEVHFHKLPLKYSKYYHRRHRRMRI